MAPWNLEEAIILINNFHPQVYLMAQIFCLGQSGGGETEEKEVACLF